MDQHHLHPGTEGSTRWISTTYIQGLKAVPAENMFAALAHHLGAAVVSLNGYAAHGAAFDLCVLSVAEGNAGIEQYITVYF